eukprot:GFUD01059635.1.p1 GENE.GFUD01059635.1~~GFUD01059635.1.p1  ORF type:complete len:117 (-),score=10.86 GFUD01059635.1:124-474(-)
MFIGAIIIILVWITTYIHEIAGPVLWIIIGIFVFFHGLIAYFQPPEINSLEVVLNGTWSAYILPLRHILVCMTNTICGITGIITMICLPHQPCHLHPPHPCLVGDWSVLHCLVLCL